MEHEADTPCLSMKLKIWQFMLIQSEYSNSVEFNGTYFKGNSKRIPINLRELTRNSG